MSECTHDLQDLKILPWSRAWMLMVQVPVVACLNLLSLLLTQQSCSVKVQRQGRSKEAQLQVCDSLYQRGPMVVLAGSAGAQDSVVAEAMGALGSWCDNEFVEGRGLLGDPENEPVEEGGQGDAEPMLFIRVANMAHVRGKFGFVVFKPTPKSTPTFLGQWMTTVFLPHLTDVRDHELEEHESRRAVLTLDGANENCKYYGQPTTIRKCQENDLGVKAACTCAHSSCPANRWERAQPLCRGQRKSWT